MTDVTDVAEAQIPTGSIAGLAELLPAPLKPLARLAWPVEKLDRRRSLIVLVVLWVLLTVAFGEIGRQLGTMHIPGDPSYRLEVLTPRFGGLKASLTEVLTTWNSWQVSNPVAVTGVPDTAPADLVRLSLFLDAFYPAVSAALLGLLGWKALWPAPPADQTTVRSRALRQVVAVAVATVPLYLLADYAENVVLSSAVFARPQGQTWLNVALLIVVFGAIVVAYGDAVSTWLRERQHGTAARWVRGGSWALPVGLTLAAVVAWLVDAPLRLEGTWASRSLLVASNTKWTLIALISLPLVIEFGRRGARWLSTHHWSAVGRGVLLVRASLLGAAVVMILPFLPSNDLRLQVEDALVRTVTDPVRVLLAAVALGLLLGVLLASGDRCVAAQETAPRPVSFGVRTAWKRWPARRRALAVVVALLAAGAVAAIAIVADLVIPVLAVLLTVALVVLLSVPGKVQEAELEAGDLAPPPARAVARSLLQLVLIAVPVSLAIFLVRGTVALWISESLGHRDWTWWPSLVCAVALAGLAAVVAIWMPEHTFGGPRSGLAKPTLLVGLVAAAVVSGAAAAAPVTLGQGLGSLGVLLLGGILLTVVITGLVLFGSRYQARGALAVVGFQRLPLLLLVLVVVLIDRSLPSSTDYHAVRLTAPTIPEVSAKAGPTPTAAFGEWVAQARPEGATGQPIPMVFVATAGGGIKAAFSTALVLGCLEQGDQQLYLSSDAPDATAGGNTTTPHCPSGRPLPRSSIFVASGLSGGSLGLAIDQARSMATPDQAPTLSSTLQGALAQDFVGPDLAAMFWRDLPYALLRRASWGDRASILEDAWTDAYRDSAPGAPGLDSDFLAAARAPDGTLRFPMLLLNSGAVEDRCRVAVTALDLAPRDAVEPGRCTAAQPGAGTGRSVTRTKDLGDYLCAGQDLDLSTAALLSARFPLVSPAGNMRRCPDAAGDAATTSDVDGGLVESSGAGPLPDLWQSIEPAVRAYNDDPAHDCVAPHLLLIDHDFRIPTRQVAGASSQLSAPTGFVTNDAAASSAAQQQAIATFEHAFADVAADARCGSHSGPSTARVQLALHPGLSAPLGWTLSAATRAEMVSQINESLTRCQLVVVRSWFGAPDDAGGDACVTGRLTDRSIVPGRVEIRRVSAEDGEEPLVVGFADRSGRFELPVRVAAAGATSADTGGEGAPVPRGELVRLCVVPQPPPPEGAGWPRLDDTDRQVSEGASPTCLERARFDLVPGQLRDVTTTRSARHG